MSDPVAALGRALNESLGVNRGRTEISVLIRDLERRGFRIVPATTPQFHVQPAPSDGESLTKRREAVLERQRSTKEGPGRV